MAVNALACTRCGGFDATLRVSVFTYVVSLVVLSVKRPVAGLYCARCRKVRGLQLAALTAVVGWWGIPWGIAWSIDAIVRDTRGGTFPDAPNAVLLPELAAQMRSRGQELAAADVLEEGRRFAAAALVTAARAARPPWRRPLVQVLAGVLVLGVVGAVVAGVLAGPSETALRPLPSPSTVVAADFSVSLPSGWYRVDLDPARIDASLAELQRSYGVNGAPLKDRASGAKLIAVYVGPEIVGAANVPVLTITTGQYAGPGGLAAVLDGLMRGLARDSRVTAPTQRRTQTAEGEVGVLEWSFSAPGAPGVADYVFYRSATGGLYFLRFDVDAALASRLADSDTSIVGSFHPAR